MSKNSSRTQWFTEAGFGMFIHWGIYSIPGRGEWVMFQEQIPAEEYEKLARQFKPKRFDADAWAALARDAGMKYMVLTTRHHDGFCLFDSRVSDFTSVKTAARRDFVAEYARACRRAGLKVGFYYSLGDWRWPVLYRGPRRDPRGWKKLVDYVYAQVEELCANYGRVDLLWYDGGFCAPDRNLRACEIEYGSRRLNAMVRRLQPHILINNRSGRPEDFDTPEQRITASQAGRPWESCMTLNRHWGYFADDDLWKSPREVVHNLTACACGGGNYLLNVGPKPDGTIPEPGVRCLREVGRWLKRNGDAIYGAERCSVGGATFGVTTARGKMIYLLVHWWPGRTMKVPEAGIRPKSARILSTGQKVKFERRGNDLFFTDLPVRPPDPFCTVIALKT